jgi:hypothetical protein
MCSKADILSLVDFGMRGDAPLYGKPWLHTQPKEESQGLQKVIFLEAL